MADLGAFGTTNGPEAMFGPKVLLTYGGGPTTDYATSVFDVPADGKGHDHPGRLLPQARD